MMTFRMRIASWVVLSCILLIGVMILTGYRQLEEELREGRVDPSHPRNPHWVIHNSYAEEEIEDILAEMMRIWLWTAVPMIGLSLGAGLLLARRSLQPVRDINRQLAGMRPDSLHGGITIPEADPSISDLAAHLNGLLEQAGSAYREVAGFSARVAHELRTPLMLLRLRVEHAPAGMPPGFQEEIQDELARLSRFVERSLLAVKAEQGMLSVEMAPLAMDSLVEDVAEGYQILAAERNLVLQVDLERDLRVKSDADLLRQAVHGLLENAVRYAKSWIRLSCKSEDGGAVLEFRNDCDPASMAPSGLGLGLRMVRGICQACGMTLESRSSGDEFAIEVRIPGSRNPDDIF
jgi:signal transduction histidine kinase